MKRAASQQAVRQEKSKKARRVVKKYLEVFHFGEKQLIAKSLQENGFAVVDMDLAANYRANIRSFIDLEILRFPEFKCDAAREPLGGFAAFGNPASFHNPTVRRLRMESYEKIAPVLDMLKPTEEYKKEAIIDRLMVRPKGASPSAESWHRDESECALHDDIVLGGWWNFDDASSYLSCVQSSHKGMHGNKGFTRVSKEQAEKFSAENIHVEVPPGCVLLFNEQLAHEVLAKKLPYKSYRLFLGWRVTKSVTPLDIDLVQKLEQQAAMKIKSGQESPMWAKLHWTNWVEKLSKFSEQFLPQCTQKMTVKSGKNQGKTYDIVHRHMSSLQSYNLPKYPKYLPQEINILIPH